LITRTDAIPFALSLNHRGGGMPELSTGNAEGCIGFGRMDAAMMKGIAAPQAAPRIAHKYPTMLNPPLPPERAVTIEPATAPMISNTNHKTTSKTCKPVGL